MDNLSLLAAKAAFSIFASSDVLVIASKGVAPLSAPKCRWQHDYTFEHRQVGSPVVDTLYSDHESLSLATSASVVGRKVFGPNAGIYE